MQTTQFNAHGNFEKDKQILELRSKLIRKMNHIYAIENKLLELLEKGKIDPKVCYEEIYKEINEIN